MKLFVSDKEKIERLKFINYLYSKGFILSKDCNETDLVNSHLPITIEDKKIDYVRTNLIASSSIKSHISIDEAKEIIEKL